MYTRPKIVQIREPIYRCPPGSIYTLGGAEVTTDDGQTWFHPYIGSQPWRVDEEKKS